MNWFVRKWYIVSGVWSAVIFIGYRFRPRKVALFSLLSSLPVKSSLQEMISARVKQYIPPFLLIEYYYSRVSDQLMSSAMRHKSMVMNGLTPLFDDLVDEQSWETEALKQVFIAPGHQHLNGKALVCRYLFQQGGFVWNAYWEDVFQAQIESKKQLGISSISIKELTDITFQKGAASVILGWHIIGEEWGGEAMKNLAGRFGAYAQLVNDIFDVWKDREAGVQTLATTLNNMNVLAKLHQEWQHEVVAAISHLNISSTRKQRLSGSLVPLFCLADLAIERLLKLQIKTGEGFQINNCTRKELVCDMAEWSNRLRWGWLMLSKK